MDLAINLSTICFYAIIVFMGAHSWFKYWLDKKRHLAINRLPLTTKPTVEWISPTEYECFVQGRIYHNTEGPAINHKGFTAWMVNGVPHRLEGAAKIWPDKKEYWLYGKQYSEKAFYKEVKRIKSKKWYSKYTEI